jgi:sugar-phosphatase
VIVGRALLFDLDGVLADSTGAIERRWREWAVRHELDAEALLRLVHGRRALEIIREVAPRLDAEAELAALAAAEAEDTDGVVALPGAAAILGALPARQWAVVTSGVRPVALARLRACALPVPSVLVTADQVARGKPDPEGYLTAARQLGILPGDCIVVEDAPPGIAAARAGGMRCIALTTTHAPAAVAGADLVVPTLADLELRVDAAGGGPARLAIARG